MGAEIAFVIIVAVLFLIAAVLLAPYVAWTVVAILAIVGVVFLIISAIAILGG